MECRRGRIAGMSAVSALRDTGLFSHAFGRRKRAKRPDIIQRVAFRKLRVVLSEMGLI